MSKSLRVLLVAEADDALMPVVLDELRRSDYDLEFETVDTPAQMRQALAEPRYDVILAAHQLRHFSAAEALASLREQGLDIPCLVVSAATDPAELRAAANLGAQDLLHPESLARLAPAVERELQAARVRAARTLTEAALREAEARYRRLVEQLPVGLHLIDLDPAGSTLSISPPLERILGFSLAEWVAEPDLWRRQIHPEDRERALAELAHVYAPGAGPAIAEYRMLTRAGQTIWIRDETILVHDSAGRPQYLQSVKLDVTERRLVELEAAKTQASLARWVAELEQSHREAALLDELSRYLQTCQTPAEVYPVAADFTQLLFPAESGALYRLVTAEAAPGQAVAVARWGRHPPEADAFPPEDCLALRDGQAVMTTAATPGARCPHLGAAPLVYALCVPLIARGQTLGSLQLSLPRGPAAKPSEARQHLAAGIADRLALALVNLDQPAERAPKPGDPASGEGGEPPSQKWVVGPLVLNCRTYELMVGERIVKPTPVEFELLQFLMRQAGQVFTAEQLLQNVWGYPPGTGSQELVRAHVKNLRAKLEPNPRRPIYLRTIGRFGYTISAEATSPEAGLRD